MLLHNYVLSVCAPGRLALSIRHGLLLRPIPGRAWLAGKLLPEGTAKQILFKLSQFVLSCKLYVTRNHRVNHLISAQRNDGVFLLETYRILLAKTGNAMIKPVLF
jgi:hypothetical protein